LPCALGDVARRRRLEAAFAEHLDRGSQQREPRLCAAAEIVRYRQGLGHAGRLNQTIDSSNARSYPRTRKEAGMRTNGPYSGYYNRPVHEEDTLLTRVG